MQTCALERNMGRVLSIDTSFSTLVDGASASIGGMTQDKFGLNASQKLYQSV